MSKIITLTIWMLLFAVSVQAQNQPAVVDTLQLDDITVTATKLPISLKETIRPVTIITRNDIEKTPSSNISQILQEQAGIRVNNSLGAPAENRSLFLQGAGGEYTLILIDGVAVNDPSGVGGAIDLRILPTHNIERIEVLKGNQSALYGADALAGVVNIITKKGEGKPISASVNAEYGSYNTGKVAASVDGTISPVLTYSAGFSRDFTDGISAAAAPDGEEFEDDGFTLQSYFANATVSLSEKIQLRPFFTYSEFNGDYDADAFTDAENSAMIKMLNPGVEGRYTGDKISATLVYQFTQTEREFATTWGLNEFEGRFQNADFFMNYTPQESLNFLAGLNVQKASIPERALVEDIEVLPELSADFLSPYATAMLRTAVGFEAEAGVRLNSHSDYGQNITYNVAPAFRISENAKIFASAGTGFKAPTLEQLFGQFGANPELEPETSTNYQAGIDISFGRTPFRLQSHYFIRNIENLIAYGTNGYINRDEENTRGIELSVDWLASQRLSIRGNYTYLTGETIVLDENGNTISEDGLIRKPSHSAGIRASSQLTNKLGVVLHGEYNSERTDLFFNPANGFAAEEVELDPFFLAHVYAEYQIVDNRITLYGAARNLFDTDFTEIYGYNTLGTHIKAGLRVNI